MAFCPWHAVLYAGIENLWQRVGRLLTLETRLHSAPTPAPAHPCQWSLCLTRPNAGHMHLTVCALSSLALEAPWSQ